VGQSFCSAAGLLPGVPGGRRIS